MSWKTVKLIEVCCIEKGNTGIMKAIPGDYPMVTMAEERKTHNEYQFDAKAIIIPMVSGSGHGKASINRIHYQEGKFAVGTILCVVIPKDHDVLEPLFLYHYCDVFKEELFVPLMRGMANVTLPMKALEELEIPLPPIDFQRKWVAKFEHISEKQTVLRTELTHQQSLLTRLRQSILQEAVQGQLTTQWRQANPNQEPASELLRRIQAEKAATGKKEKPLPPVKAEEMPFELPEGWVWCRLGEICSFLNGYAFKSELFKNAGIKLLRNINMGVSKIVWNETAYLPNEEAEKYKGYNLEENDIVLSLDRPIISEGLKVAIVKNKDLPCLLLQRVLKIVPLGGIQHKYVFNWFNTNLFINKINPERSIGIPHISHKEVENILFPLPPLPEQAAIVAQVERLVGLVGQLESEAAGQRVQAEGLLQAALREAMG